MTLLSEGHLNTIMLTMMRYVLRITFATDIFFQTGWEGFKWLLKNISRPR
jgi:hypothetical protein